MRRTTGAGRVVGLPPAPGPAPVVPAVTETTLFSDAFAAFDASQWPTRVITGTQDSTIRFAATGGRIVAALAKLLAEKGSGRGLVSICAAGGQGVVAILER